MYSTMWHVLRSGNVVVFHNHCSGVWADRGHVLLQTWDPATGVWSNPSDALVAAARPTVGPPSPEGFTGCLPEESSSEDEVGPSQLHPTPDRRWAVAGPSVTPTGRGRSPGAAPTPPRVMRSISEEEALLDSPGQADPMFLGNPWGCRRCPSYRQLCASCEALAREEYQAEQASAEAYLLQKTNEANELAAAQEEARCRPPVGRVGRGSRTGGRRQRLPGRPGRRLSPGRARGQPPQPALKRNPYQDLQT